MKSLTSVIAIVCILQLQFFSTASFAREIDREDHNSNFAEMEAKRRKAEAAARAKKAAEDRLKKAYEDGKSSTSGLSGRGSNIGGRSDYADIQAKGKYVGNNAALLGHTIFGAMNLSCDPDETDTGAGSYYLFKAACADYLAGKIDVANAQVNLHHSRVIEDQDVDDNDVPYRTVEMAVELISRAKNMAKLEGLIESETFPSFEAAYIQALKEKFDKTQRIDDAKDMIDDAAWKLTLYLQLFMPFWAYCVCFGFPYSGPPIVEFITLQFVIASFWVLGGVYLMDIALRKLSGHDLLKVVSNDLSELSVTTLPMYLQFVPFAIFDTIDDERGKDHHNDDEKGREDAPLDIPKEISLNFLKQLNFELLDKFLDFIGIRKAYAICDVISCGLSAALPPILPAWFAAYGFFLKLVKDLFDAYVELAYGKIHTHLKCEDSGGTAVVELQRENIIRSLTASRYDVATIRILLDRALEAKTPFEKYTALKNWSRFLRKVNNSVNMNRTDFVSYAQLRKMNSFKLVNILDGVKSLINRLVPEGYATNMDAPLGLAGGTKSQQEVSGHFIKAGKDQLEAWPIPETRVDYLADFVDIAKLAEAFDGGAFDLTGINLGHFEDLLGRHDAELDFNKGFDETDGEQIGHLEEITQLTRDQARKAFRSCKESGTCLKISADYMRYKNEIIEALVSGEATSPAAYLMLRVDARSDNNYNDYTKTNIKLKNANKAMRAKLAKDINDLNKKLKAKGEKEILTDFAKGKKGSKAYLFRDDKDGKNASGNKGTVAMLTDSNLSEEKKEDKEKVEKEGPDYKMADFGDIEMGDMEFDDEEGRASNRKDGKDKKKDWNRKNRRHKDRGRYKNQIHPAHTDLFKIISRRYVRTAFPIFEIFSDD